MESRRRRAGNTILGYLGDSCLIQTVKFRKKPRGLYFSKAFFEGLIFEGAYVRSEICVLKSIGLGLFLERNLLFFFVALFSKFYGVFLTFDAAFSTKTAEPGNWGT